MKTRHPLLIGLIPTIIFGFSFMFTKIAIVAMGNVYQVLSIRFLIAAIGLWLLKKLGVIKIAIKGKPLVNLLLLSVFQPILYFIFEILGIKYTSSSETGVMIAFIPVAVAILAHFVLGERTTRRQWRFIFISIAGVVLVNLEGVLGSGSLLGKLFLLLTVMSAGAYQVLARKNAKDFRPIEITYVMMWTGAIAFTLIAIISGASMQTYLMAFSSLKVVASMAYLGILSSIIAFLFLNDVLGKLAATKVSVLSNITTIVSILAGVILLGESFTLWQVAGSTLILLGVWGTSTRQRKIPEMIHD